ncbi:hypothetical protein ACFPVT_02245 [Corynebacterium choanae]|uniref:Uncharacterized protein n=1 Tax=Corynebacterium choanae TaxID=1862358 RepID=A0A3G6J5B1_9CORY|nr:hypothetical protein [Corynebacterium choanae]AZA12943.1 hypothetical protein CCHOA_02630 [Corynebacterium choanae]
MVEVGGDNTSDHPAGGRENTANQQPNPLPASTADWYTLRPGTAVFWREAGLVQFGISPRGCVVLDVGSAQLAKHVAALFRRCQQPQRLTVLIDNLGSTGIPTEQATTLVGDLQRSGMLIHHPPAALQVALVGTSPLATAIEQLCNEQAVEVTTPRPGQRLRQFISHISPHIPLLFIDSWHHVVTSGFALSRRGGTTIPVAMIDDCGIIGPVMMHGAGPCPTCVLLHQLDQDPLWAQTVQQYHRTAIAPDPILIAHTAATTAAAVISTLQRDAWHQSEPLQQQHHPAAGGGYGWKDQQQVPLYGSPLFAGDCFTVQLRRPHVSGTTVQRHPRCPYCLSYPPPAWDLGIAAGHTHPRH